MTWSMYPDALSNTDIVEVNLVPCVDTVLRHRRYLRLIETHVSRMLLASGLCRSLSLTDVYFPALTRNAVHARDFQIQVILGSPKHVFFFFGM